MKTKCDKHKTRLSTRKGEKYCFQCSCERTRLMLDRINAENAKDENYQSALLEFMTGSPFRPEVL